MQSHSFIGNQYLTPGIFYPNFEIDYSIQNSSPSLPSQSPVEVKVQKKRGRKSLIPLEERETTRRFKKRNMERKRRAYIAEKMSALHALTLNLVGEDPTKHQKMEKADILNLCHTVMRGLTNLVSGNPELAEKMRQELGEQIKDLHCDQRSLVTATSNDDDDFEEFDEGIVDVESVDENKENHLPSPTSSIRRLSGDSHLSAFRRPTVFSTPMRDLSNSSSSITFTTNSSDLSSSSRQSSGFSSSSLLSSNSSDVPLNLVWRPF